MIKKMLTVLLTVLIAFTTVTFNVAATTEETEIIEDKVENDAITVEEEKQDETLSEPVVNDSLEEFDEQQEFIEKTVSKNIEEENEGNEVKYKLSKCSQDGGFSSNNRSFIFVDTKTPSESAHLLVFEPETGEVSSQSITVTGVEGDCYVIGQQLNAEAYCEYAPNSSYYLKHKVDDTDYYLIYDNETGNDILACSSTSSNKLTFVPCRDEIADIRGEYYDEFHLGEKVVTKYYYIYNQTNGKWSKTESYDSDSNPKYAYIYEKVVNEMFDANGGAFSDGEQSKVIETVGDYFILPEEPTREGYKFNGWYTEKDDGEEIGFSFDGIEHTFYAHWVKYVEYEKITESDCSNLTGNYIIANIQESGGKKKSTSNGTHSVHLMTVNSGGKGGINVGSSPQAVYVDDSTIKVVEGTETFFSVTKPEDEYYLKTTFNGADYYLYLSESAIIVDTTNKTSISINNDDRLKIGDDTSCYAFWDENNYKWIVNTDGETYLYKLKENTPTISTIGDVLKNFAPDFPTSSDSTVPIEAWLADLNKCYIDGTQLKFIANSTRNPVVELNNTVVPSENGYIYESKDGYSVSFVLDSNVLERVVFAADNMKGRMYNAYNGTYTIPHICNGIAFARWAPSEHNSKLPEKSGNWYLTEDITLYNDWSAWEYGNTSFIMNVCLNGHAINMSGYNAYMCWMATLNLYDCNTTTEHKGYIDANGLWHLDEEESHELLTNEKRETIIGGLITGGGESAISMDDSSTLNMYGGTICGNYNNYNPGAGIHVSDSSHFNMYGGTICYNTDAISGGGVSIDSSSNMTMYGGSITNNKSSIGGGISNNGVLNLTASPDKEINITGNVATDAVGGVVNSGTMSLSGKVTIKDNVCENKYNESINYPINLGTSSPITISGALTGSSISITHVDEKHKHNTGVLTSGYKTHNPDAVLNTFFIYEGPSDFCKFVLNPDDAASNPGELKVVSYITPEVKKIEDEKFVYDGNGIEPELVFTYPESTEGSELTKGVDYTVEYLHNINSSRLMNGDRDENRPSVVVTLNNDNYLFDEDKTTYTVYFDIAPMTLDISLNNEIVEHGSSIPSVSFTNIDGDPITLNLLADGVDLDNVNGYQTTYYKKKYNSLDDVNPADIIDKNSIKDVGEYSVVVLVSRNYQISEEEEFRLSSGAKIPRTKLLTFEIVKSTEKIAPVLLTSTFTYNGFNQINNLKFDCDKDKVVDKIVSPYLTFPKSSYDRKDIAINAGTYVTYLKINDPSKYEWDTENVKLTKDNKYAIIEWTIEPATVKASIKDNAITYDGNTHKPTPSVVITSGLLTGLPLSSKSYSLAYSKDTVNCGDKEVTIILNKNYCFEYGTEPIYSVSLPYIINPKPVTIDWSKQTSFVYNGSEQKPTPYISIGGIVRKDLGKVDAESSLTVEVLPLIYVSTDKSIDVGNYKATAKLVGEKAGNYVLTANYLHPTTKEFTITPKTVHVHWDVKDYVYDGEKHSPNLVFDDETYSEDNIDYFQIDLRLGDLPEDNKFTEDELMAMIDEAQRANGADLYRFEDAGEYCSFALITGKTSNYKFVGTNEDDPWYDDVDPWIHRIAFTDFTIDQRELKVLWSDKVKFKYNGKEQGPDILGAVAIIDGEEVEPGIVARDEGVVELKLDITNGKKIKPGSNYKAEAILASKGTNHRANNYRIVENKTINFKIYRTPREDSTPVKTGVDR